MNDEDYFRINGHYPIEPGDDVRERFAGEEIPADWYDEDDESSCDECKGDPHPEFPGWIICSTCGCSVNVTGSNFEPPSNSGADWESFPSDIPF